MRVAYAAMIVGALACRGSAPAEAPSAATPASPDRPDILLIVPDSLSGNRVGRVRDGRPVTPNLDALVARGATFTHMYAQAGWTLPSLASLLSGRWPLVPEAKDGRSLAFLRTDRKTMPELFADAGYRTAVFWGPGMAEVAPEFSRGFETVVHEAEGDPYEAHLLAWLDDDDPRPFFAMVHDVDLQFPVVPVPGHPLLSTPPASAAMGMEPTFQELFRRGGREAAMAAMDVAYDAAISRYDAAIGRMIAGLGERGLTDDTVVVVTSNHGLDMGEHGHYFHGTLLDTNLHVPLVIADPRIPSPGRAVDTVVQTLDVAPTLLARAGLRASADLPGASIGPLLGIGEGTYTSRDVYSITTTSSMSIRTERYKVARVAEKGAPAGSGRLQAFDLVQDPTELHELAAPYPPEVDVLVGKLDAWTAERMEETAKFRPGVHDDAALKQALKDQGYWGVVTGEEAGTGGRKAPAGAAVGPATGGPVGPPMGGPVGPPGVYPPPPGTPRGAPTSGTPSQPSPRPR